jgi:hypothetical protein
MIGESKIVVIASRVAVKQSPVSQHWLVEKNQLFSEDCFVSHTPRHRTMIFLSNQVVSYSFAIAQSA